MVVDGAERSNPVGVLAHALIAAFMELVPFVLDAILRGPPSGSKLTGLALAFLANSCETPETLVEMPPTAPSETVADTV